MYRKRWPRRRLIGTLAAIAAAYAVMLAAIQLVGHRLDQGSADEVYGDLTHRFGPELSLTYNGQTYTYRDKQLVNILLIGVDADEMTADGGRFGDQADFMLLLCVDKRNKQILPIHIDRDTMTEIQIYGVFGNPAGTRVTQLCLAQAFGADAAAGSRNTVSAVSRLFSGIPIDYYMTMDMGGIAALNDALGGVTVTLEDDFSHIDPAMKKGATICLQGEQAEIFVRRRRDVSDGTNASRMRRQREYMDAALDVLLERMASDLDFVGNLYDTLSPQMTTDMDRGFLINEAYGYAKYACGDIMTLAGTHAVGEDGFMEFYPDPQALQALVIDSFFE